MAQTRPISDILDKLAASGIAAPSIYIPQQSGFGSVSEHNKGVDSLFTAVDNIYKLKGVVEQELKSHLSAVREQEGWAESQRLAIQASIDRGNNTEISFNKVVALNATAEVAQPYIDKQRLSIHGELLEERGPWLRISAIENGSPYGSDSSARWRLWYDRDCSISEVVLGVSPETVHFYNIGQYYVDSVDGQSVSVAGLSITPHTVQVDVVSGPSKGMWFLCLASGPTLSSVPTLYSGDDLEIGIRCDSFYIGNGSYEIEYLDCPVLTSTLDIVVGATGNAWIGLPRADAFLKIYEPVSLVTSVDGPLPGKSLKLSTNELLPKGSNVDYLLPTQVKSTPVDSNEVINTADLVQVQRIKEEITLDRFNRVTLSWLPYIDIDSIVENYYGFDPNLGGSSNYTTLEESFGQTGETYTDYLARWNCVGATVATGGLTWTTSFTAGTESALENVALLATSSHLMLKTEYGQPYGTSYDWAIKLSSNLTTATLSDLSSNSWHEIRLRGDHALSYASIRIVIDSAGAGYCGLYNVTNGTAAAVRSTTVNITPDSWYLFNAKIDGETIVVGYTSIGGTVATLFTGVLPGLPSGPGLSYHMWGSGSASIGYVGVKSTLPSVAPIRVTAVDSGIEIPPDLTGSALSHMVPKYETVHVYEDSPGVYKLPYPAVRRVYDPTIQDGSSEAQVRVSEWIEADQSEGDRILDFEIDLKESIIRIRNQKRSGPIQVSYWTLGRRDADVPVTRNITDYISGFTKSPVSDNLDITSSTYYPIIEYSHNNNILQFAREFEKVIVEYDSRPVRLQLSARLTRGVNPCRSPRVLAAHWEVS